MGEELFLLEGGLYESFAYRSFDRHHHWHNGGTIGLLCGAAERGRSGDPTRPGDYSPLWLLAPRLAGAQGLASRLLVPVNYGNAQKMGDSKPNTCSQPRPSRRRDQTLEPLLARVALAGCASASPHSLTYCWRAVSRVHPGIYAAVVVDATWQQLKPQLACLSIAPSTPPRSVSATTSQRRSNLAGGQSARLRRRTHTSVGIATGRLDATVRSSHLEHGHELAFRRPAYTGLWTRLQGHLAAAYDSGPLIAEVAVSSVSPHDDDSFVGRSGIMDGNVVGVASDRVEGWQRLLREQGESALSVRQFCAEKGPHLAQQAAPRTSTLELEKIRISLISANPQGWVG